MHSGQTESNSCYNCVVPQVSNEEEAEKLQNATTAEAKSDLTACILTENSKKNV